MAFNQTLDERLHNICKNKISHNIDINSEFEHVCQVIGLSPKDAGGKIIFNGADPIVKSSVALGSAAAIALMAKSLAATKLWRMKGNKGQDLSIDISKSIARLSILYKGDTTLNGYTPGDGDDDLSSTMLIMKTKDGHFVCPDNNMPKLRDRMQKLIGCQSNVQSVIEHIKKYNSDWLEREFTKRGLIMGKIRTLPEFMKEKVYQDYMKNIPLVEIEKISNSDPEPLPKGDEPLSGIKALGLGHIIAGAEIGRTLAGFAADVLNVWKPDEYEFAVTYTSADLGMRSCLINYKTAEGNKQFKHLLQGADIFFGNRRWKALEENHLTAKDCAKIRPGIIFCNTDFSGDRGDWKDRVGYDQVAGCVTGLATFDGTPKAPQLPIINVVNDSLVGWLAAAGIMEALSRRAKEGGSYIVHVSLCRVCLWLMSMGIFDKNYVNKVYNHGEHKEKKADLFTARTPLGFYQGYTDQVKMSKLQVKYNPILIPRGSSYPTWRDDDNASTWKPVNPSAHASHFDFYNLQKKIYQTYE